MNDISFKASPEERKLARQIAQRAREVDARVNPDVRRRSAMDWEMDLIAVHANGNALDFAKLAAFPDADFIHDVFGIARHIDRESGKLGGCFSPRCSV